MNMSATNQVLLVDEHDVPVGSMDKLEAHQKGVLHRAFSVFIFNNRGELLLQKRAPAKYHSGGLWTNTCCSHPVLNEEPKSAAERRLQEEMGFSVTLKFFKCFTYKAEMDNGLIEHELDHVFTGVFNGNPTPDVAEVAEWRYVSLSDLSADMQQNPSGYTAWLKIILPEVMDYPQP